MKIAPPPLPPRFGVLLGDSMPAPPPLPYVVGHSTSPYPTPPGVLLDAPRPPSPQCACYPEWLLLGMPKCGTQSLANQLLGHALVRATTARRVSGMKLRPALFLSP